MPAPITATIAKEYREAMVAFTSAKAVVDKPSSLEMQIAAVVLQAVGILNADDFLTKFSTTIGNIIYLARNLDPLQTVFVLAHEGQHVRQWYEHPFTFIVVYLQSAGRAALEGEAYTTTAECYWLFFGSKGVPAPQNIAASLPVAYGLSSNEGNAAFTMIEQGVTSCVSGGPTTTLGRWTAEWFAKNHPECLSDDARALLLPATVNAAPAETTGRQKNR